MDQESPGGVDPRAMAPTELLQLAAVSNEVFAQAFFPNTVRNTTPDGHRRIDLALDNPACRLVNIKAFRGSAKTTKTRLFLAKRIAFSMSRTALLVASSEGKASASVQWLRRRIESKRGADGEWHRPFFAEFFDLSPGKKWNDLELEIIHGHDERPIWVLGVGITGSIRGINFDDYRPDLIVGDDMLDDENTATKEQREKYSNLIYGALIKSLAPATEEPNAKFVNLQTPLDPEDASMQMAADPEFTTVEFPCWTPETMDAPLEQQRSSWEDRFPTATLQREKQNAILTNKLSVFTREMEVRLISAETAAFRPSWLRRYPASRLQEPMFNVLAIDPVPPPSETALAKNLVKLDYEAQVVVGARGGEYFVREVVTNRGHDPEWSVSTALQLAADHRVARIIVDAVAYQKVLGWLLRRKMAQVRQHWFVKEFLDKRSKYNRITSTLNGIASSGRLYCLDSHLELITQFIAYGGGRGKDDILDALSMAIADIANPFLELGVEAGADASDPYTEDLSLLQRAP